MNHNKNRLMIKWKCSLYAYLIMNTYETIINQIWFLNKCFNNLRFSNSIHNFIFVKLIMYKKKHSNTQELFAFNNVDKETKTSRLLNYIQLKR